MTKIKKVLVANRGEIACRILRTLREMGIPSVAVYSEIDKNAVFVRMADEAVALEGKTGAESYLRKDKIIAACRKVGADAVHPGYGFLSENASFVRELEAAGIRFIGPSADAIDSMGSKTAARATMIAAGVPVVPGAEVGSPDELVAAAKGLGYPVMLKAASGGGGKGMRLVHAEADLLEAYERARSEARSAFGDDTVYIEKAIVRPRHVEIQVLADQHGNAVHLFERDCSVQRRHQKVIEETPSPAAVRSDALIAAMGDVAVRAAKAVGYHSAGTVEFLLSQDGSFYFLEMNTRLQVEHPITELITGLDLVREMVRISEGEPLGFGQADIRPRGHAIQCRIYAEDPKSGFLPSPGTIGLLKVPSGPGVRDDGSAESGSEVSSYYDPLISKLCVYAATRPEAIARMRRALREYIVTGIKTNISFHQRVLESDDFQAGNYHTGFIEEHRALLLAADVAGNDAVRVAIAAALFAAGASTPAEAAVPNATPSSGALSPWRVGTLSRL